MDGYNWVMLIDDDEMTNMIHRTIIQRHAPHVRITEYSRPEDALAYLQESGNPWPDLIFLDINMPVMDGWGFLDVYSQFDQKAALFMLTSSIDPKDMTRSQRYPDVSGFISKPLTPDILRGYFGERAA